MYLIHIGNQKTTQCTEMRRTNKIVLEIEKWATEFNF